MHVRYALSMFVCQYSGRGLGSCGVLDKVVRARTDTVTNVFRERGAAVLFSVILRFKEATINEMSESLPK